MIDASCLAFILYWCASAFSVSPFLTVIEPGRDAVVLVDFGVDACEAVALWPGFIVNR